ncbi:diamine acetyltransferase 1-like [Rhipicephalus sanguineus]|uniref:diamine acetyltransferase 1-like n=1 Tax=Rhipicephalus sanguineus TaxID=34632 RepID=UPI00189602DB|nr:diamine acetyltransferase 1-like [Rhipicephalus sanguineus]
MEGGGGSSSGGAKAKAPAEGSPTLQEESAVRKAEPQDCATILRYVHALAHFHNMPDAVHIDLQQLEHAMFKSNPRQLWAFIATIRRRDTAKALVAAEESPAGMVTFHYRYSAALGGRILYIEDLIVSEECRGRGLGVALLRAACEQALRDCCRAVQFKVHKDNKGAQRLYLKNGAVDLSEAGDVRLFYFDRDSRFPHPEEKEKAR